MNHDIDSWHPLVVIETVMEWTAMMGYTVIYTVLAQVATLCYGGEYAYSFKYVWGCWTFVYLAFRQICKLERPFWSPFLIDPLLASHTTRRGAATEQWHTHRHTTWWTPSTVTVTFIGMFIHLFLVLSGDLARLGYSEYSSPQLQIAILSHLLRLSVTWKSNAWPGSEWLTCFELEDSYRIRMPGKVSFQSLCPKKDPKGEDTSKKHLICQSASSSFGRFFKASSAPGTRRSNACSKATLVPSLHDNVLSTTRPPTAGRLPGTSLCDGP